MNTMAAASGTALDGDPALLHFARRQDVIAWAPTRLPDPIIGACGTSPSSASRRRAGCDVRTQSATLRHEIR